ncbi:probable galactose-1-phosphate uridylyltransferase [Acyrthosiphon pisum]|uniref:Galactose-1-phosphate uridylyltransferase n=2 Tax=Acyrthosiphon pisum TaxID=7029 RepID=A0A8R2A9T3_ACYPI|nr:probable galactose-1-phosphate uridylyltransferase [Acyrthosiphon pisum]|eukprot:XP_001943396.2 PREDICTED: probable galactose-1-phosphate uridylyltransferase [Acyrthosiphon pisum]
MEFNASEHPHRRYNPLKGEWILVSPHRMKRPWDGQTESVHSDMGPEFDPTNPLCPGVVRSSGILTPEYKSTYVFTNDFPAMLEDTPSPPQSDDPLFQIEGVKGTCRVMCFYPKSNVTIALMSINDIVTVISSWIQQLEELGKTYTWVQIFENKGTMMGCSNHHPHCQIWACSFLPNEPRIKDINQREYLEKHGRPMLMDYVDRELKAKIRIVTENQHWVVLVPFWAIWPYETMVLPKRHVKRMNEITEHEKTTLASVMKILTIKYDNMFKTSFPYSMGWHGAPTGPNCENSDHWVFHGIYLPPLLRSATVKKFISGFELLAQCQRDLTAEQAAERLRSQSDVHYLE